MTAARAAISVAIMWCFIEWKRSFIAWVLVIRVLKFFFLLTDYESSPSTVGMEGAQCQIMKETGESPPMRSKFKSLFSAAKRPSQEMTLGPSIQCTPASPLGDPVQDLSDKTRGHLLTERR